MAFSLSCLSSVILLVSACTPASAPAEPDATALRLIHDAHQNNAKIIHEVKGDPKTHNADELWCVQTDQNAVGGNLPFLLVVWRTGTTWQGDQLYEGFYDWDAQGCPRP